MPQHFVSRRNAAANRLVVVTATILSVIISMSNALAQDDVVAGVDPEFSALIARCAPTVHPETMAAVVSAESRGHQFAIADAGPVKLPWAIRKTMVRSFYPGTLAEAVAKAQELINNGHTVSLGFAQVNDRNLRSLGVPLRDVFDSCTNIAAGGRILTEFYNKASKQFGEGPKALQAALSAYNSGDWLRGARDGYVKLVYQQLGKPLSIRTTPVIPRLRTTTALNSAGWQASEQKSKARREFVMKVSDFAVE